MEPIVLEENERYLVVDKPAGLVVHADGRTDEPSLSDYLVARYPSQQEVGGMHTLDNGRYLPRVGILHRLDRETSGVILIAKDDEAFYFLQRQFLDRSIEKIYRAFVHGVPSPEEGTIDSPIGRSRSDFRRFATGQDARGTLRKALTEYRTRKKNERYAFLELSPKTGRTHQLRVHLSSIGHPILADARYGGAPALGFSRLALHASRLSFTAPSGERVSYEAPLPVDFQRAEAEIAS
jgi:23S rRNA pseudouridine1911/1915/1917 synthase